jgi:hypothetical protein
MERGPSMVQRLLGEKALAHSPLPHFLQLDRIVLLAEPAKMAQNMNN